MKISQLDTRRGGWAAYALPRRIAAARGFTLVELLVVLLIILAASLAAIGSYANLRRARSVRTAAESIQALFVGARAYAVTTNSPYRVVFQLQEPSTGQEAVTYWIDEIFRGDQSGSASVTVPEEAKTPKITTPERLPDGVSLADFKITRFQQPIIPATTITVTPATARYVVVRFFPDGSSDEATVRLMPDGSATATDNPRVYSIRLLAPTAKAKLISVQRQ